MSIRARIAASASAPSNRAAPSARPLKPPRLNRLRQKHRQAPGLQLGVAEHHGGIRGGKPRSVLVLMPLRRMRVGNEN